MENIDFLLASSEPWVVYRTMQDILQLDYAAPQVMQAKKSVLDHPLIQGLIEELKLWPGTVISSHKSASQLYHKLAFLADLGLNQQDPDIVKILQKVTEHSSDEGLYRLPMNIAEHYGGTGQQQWAWALCDAPLLLYASAKMSPADNSGVKPGVNFLAQLNRANGWPCVVSKELGKFRGPGRKDDPCPYATLLMLKLLAMFEDYRDGEEAHLGVECLLDLWDKSQERHPYMFFMGTDFRKLKAPFIWYDILQVAEVLSQYPRAREDSRFLTLLDCINSKADNQRLFTPESVWQAWQTWDFGQKKQPSAWLTFLVYRINRRLNRD